VLDEFEDEANGAMEEEEEMMEEYDPEDVAQLNQQPGTGEIIGGAEGYVRVGNNLQRPVIVGNGFSYIQPRQNQVMMTASSLLTDHFSDSHSHSHT